MELKIYEYKDNRFSVTCIDVDVLESFDSIEEAVSKAHECLDAYLKVATKEEVQA